MNRRLNGLTMGIILAVGILTACTPNAAPNNTTSTPDKVSIQLGWIYDFTTAQFYTAEKMGRYAAQNLQVDFQQGGFVDGKYVEAVEEVVAGKADFGLSSDIGIMQARANGQPLVAIAAMTQRSPEAILSLEKSNIRRPQDLIGKKVAVADGVARELYNSFLRAQKIDAAQVTTVARTTYGIEPLLNGEVDAIVGWTINEGIQLQQNDAKPNIMLLSDFGIEYYNTVLFTTEKMINEKPEVVQKFLAATLQGITDVVANPNQAVDYTMSYGKDLNRETQSISLQAMIPLINPPGSKPGTMDEGIWRGSFQMGVDEKVLDKSLDITNVYTLSFLNKIYQ